MLNFISARTDVVRALDKRQMDYEESLLPVEDKDLKPRAQHSPKKSVHANKRKSKWAKVTKLLPSQSEKKVKGAFSALIATHTQESTKTLGDATGKSVADALRRGRVGGNRVSDLDVDSSDSGFGSDDDPSAPIMPKRFEKKTIPLRQPTVYGGRDAREILTKLAAAFRSGAARFNMHVLFMKARLRPITDFAQEGTFSYPELVLAKDADPAFPGFGAVEAHLEGAVVQAFDDAAFGAFVLGRRVRDDADAAHEAREARAVARQEPGRALPQVGLAGLGRELGEFGFGARVPRRGPPVVARAGVQQVEQLPARHGRIEARRPRPPPEFRARGAPRRAGGGPQPLRAPDAHLSLRRAACAGLCDRPRTRRMGRLSREV